MALMRYRSRPRPRSVYAAIAPDDRQPEHLGNVPPAPAEPPKVRWSLTRWPATEPIDGEETADA